MTRPSAVTCFRDRAEEAWLASRRPDAAKGEGAAPAPAAPAPVAPQGAAPAMPRLGFAAPAERFAPAPSQGRGPTSIAPATSPAAPDRPNSPVQATTDPATGSLQTRQGQGPDGPTTIVPTPPEATEERTRQGRRTDVPPASAPTTPEATGTSPGLATPAEAADQGTRQVQTLDGEPASAPPTVLGATGPERAPAPTPTEAPAAPPRQPLTARWLARQGREIVRATLAAMTDHEVQGLPYLFEFWAHPHQLPPGGDWRTWVILGGRGAGKTRAGAEWVRAQVEGPRPRDPGRARRVALLAETLDQAREVMIFGDSGLMACSPPDRRPTWHATRRMLEWPNGAVAQIFSAHDPESLRGPQFDAAWADELAKWKKAEQAWDQLQFALRLGDDPRCVVTTTPKATPALSELLERPGTVQTQAPTSANRAFLARGFMEEMRARFDGTRLGRQELEGLLLDEADGALWTAKVLDHSRVQWLPRFDRVLVGVDPAASTGKGSDATGIVVVGVVTQGPSEFWKAYVLEDATVQGLSPDAWGRAVVQAAHRHGASRVVAEVNQGGAMVATILRGIDPHLPVTSVHAREGKAIRAEPVAALYERGLAHHFAGADLRKLEDQMIRMAMTGYRGKGSPDRLDALVWAIHEGVIAPSKGPSDARIRAI